MNWKWAKCRNTQYFVLGNLGEIIMAWIFRTVKFLLYKIFKKITVYETAVKIDHCVYVYRYYYIPLKIVDTGSSEC